jgi:hypothetical protein
VEEHLALTLGERIADFGVFTVQALVFLLVGGTMILVIDRISRYLGGGRVSQAQYLTVMALSLFFGLFLKWEEGYRNSQPLRLQNESLTQEISSLKKDLDAKTTNVETLERRFDKFTADLTEIGKDTGKTLRGLQEKLKERDSQIVSLQKKAAVRDQLVQLRAEGNNIVDKVLSSPTSPVPAAEREQWSANTIQYLRKNMDARHAEEFRNPPTAALHFEGLPPSHEVFVSDVEARVRVLEKFINETQ